MKSLLKINNSLVRAKVASSLILPNKGDIIKMNLDGTERQYRVLNVNGNVCKVMGMFNLTSKYNETSMTTTMGTLTVQKYEGSTLDTYLNITWYNTLSAEAKDAIVAENIICDAWYPNSNGDPAYTGTYGSSASDTKNYTISKYAGGTLNIGNRNVFALSVQDVIDYLSDESMRVDTEAILRNVNIWKMFYNSTTGEPSYPWLRSSNASYSWPAWRIHGINGRLEYNDVTYSGGVVRPALNLDFSKIKWSIATT
mgnify:CR=1 FL=1